MSETNFTPGPWKIGEHGDDIVSEKEIEGDIIAEAPKGWDKSMESWPANAKLIAAAPDMFDAIQSALNIKQLWAPSGDMPIEHEGEAHALQSMLTAFEAVIAKIN